MSQDPSDAVDDATVSLDAPTPEPRRSFMAIAIAIVTGAVTSLVPLVYGVLFFLDPIRRRNGKSEGGESTGDGYIRVTSLDAVPVDGVPRRFALIADKQDAWTAYRNVEIGSVYIRRREAGDVTEGSQLVCFNSLCPHLGCRVSYQGSDQSYICPCHASSFTATGERKNDIPPRSLDELEIDVRNGNEVWVKYVEYKAGTEERISIS